jgi:hypothetical protein
MGNVIFAAANQCSEPMSSGEFFRACQLVKVQIDVDPVSPTTNATIKQLAFVNEFHYSFVGRIFPSRNVLVTLSSDNQWRQVIPPDAAPTDRPVKTQMAYDAIATAVFTFLFPGDGVSDNNITVSKDCCFTLISNVSSPHVGSLSAYVSAIIDHYNAMVTAVAAVTSTDVSWLDVVAAATKASGVLRGVENYPGVNQIQRDMIHDAWTTLDEKIQDVHNACEPGKSDDCSKQQASTILVMQTLLNQVQDELKSAEKFVDDEANRLQGRADNLAANMKTILDQLRAVHPGGHTRKLLFVPPASLQPGHLHQEVLRALRRSFMVNTQSHLLYGVSNPEKAQPRASFRRPLDGTFRPLETYGEEAFMLKSPPGTPGDSAVLDLNMQDGSTVFDPPTSLPNLIFFSRAAKPS